METTLKKTPQRAAILKILEGNRNHPTAAEIYKKVRKKFSNISFATVYNNLERLISFGQLAELAIEPGKKRFDPFTGPHDHAICVRCGRIFDLRRKTKKIKIKKFKVLSFTTQIKTLCPLCLKKAAKNKSRKKKK